MPITESSILRAAGNIAAGMVTANGPRDPVDIGLIASMSVNLARAIAAEVERTEQPELEHYTISGREFAVMLELLDIASRTPGLLTPAQLEKLVWDPADIPIDLLLERDRIVSVDVMLPKEAMDRVTGAPGKAKS